MHHAMPFIAAVILPPLVGAHFVIENDLRRVRDRLQEHKPTIFFGVPALFEIVYRNILARAEAEGRLATLQDWQSPAAHQAPHGHQHRRRWSSARSTRLSAASCASWSAAARPSTPRPPAISSASACRCSRAGA